MANFGLQEFTTQEATNVNCFTDWNSQTLEFDEADTDDTSVYITAENPAKKIVLYVEPTVNGTSTLDINDLLTLTINGKTTEDKQIKIDPGDLPFTLTGILLTSLAIQSASGESSDSIVCLSFH
tara:strand:- start:618 stop:989 length:372 start_codon:yes stop_codon:yes gene_type:complete